MIKLIAIDLDGTLLDDAKRINAPTLQALHNLHQSQVRIVIASARPPRSVRPTYTSLRINTWQINYNGAMIWDEPTKTVVFHQPLEPELVLRAARFARKLDDRTLISCEVLDKWYTDRDDHTYTTETGKLFRPNRIAPLDQWCTVPITKLMFLGEAQMILRLESALTEEFGPSLGLVRTDADLIQVMNPRANKADALEKVARHYDVAMDEVLAIGDAPNDIDMIRRAGVGVAMDNAHPLVKAAADWIAPSNNDHGVHAALRQFGLCD